MLTRLLIGLDGSPSADAALEQAIVLGDRFKATLVVGHIVEHGKGAESGKALLENAAGRVSGAGLRAEIVLRQGDPDTELATLAKETDAVLIGRRGSTTPGAELGPTAASLIKIAERCVIVCGAQPSPMGACAIAFNDGETARRALDFAARFASITNSTIHIIYATSNHAAGVQIVGAAEAVLSLQGVAFVTHIEPGSPGEVVAQVVARTKCDALFAGAHVARGRTSKVTVSHAEEILRHTDIPVIVQP